MSKTKTYAAWLDARKRCFREKDAHYAYYGGRGITMCAEWANSFETFLRDMGEKPNGLTLERKEVDGNYEPGNCEWATKTTQSRNRRNVVASMEIATDMRRRRAAGESVAGLARAYGMKASNAQQIVSGNTWKP